MSLSGAHAAGKKRKAVCVQLLNKESYICYVDVKSKIQDVFKQVTMHLTLRETEYFGLAFLKDGEYHFISNDEKVYKHAPKVWKTNPGDGCDIHGLPLLTLYFRVQFYVDQVVLLREKVTRHLYYLQLKDNVLNYQQGCQEEKSFLIAGYALQADLGNYNTASKMGSEYFDPREYFPEWMVEKHGHTYLINNVPVVHKDLHGITRREAEWQYIKETSQLPSAHNLHFYRISKKKTDKILNAWLGICARGIEIYEDLEDGFKDLISIFLWPDIGKLTFDKKKFEIRSVGSPAGRKFKYYTGSDVKSKYLLTLSRNTHMFQMAIQPKLMEIRHLEEEDKRRYRESYVHNDQRELMTSQQGTYRANVSPHTKPSIGNRYSVVSDASSTATSGIVSDKMTVSFEENDDSNQEIMIVGPPLPTGMLLNTPSQARSKFVSTLPGYKPSPVPGANRSPILNHSELFDTFATQRVQVLASPNRLTNQTNVSSLSVQSDRSGSGQSEAFSLESGSGGSYRKQLSQVPIHSNVYSPAIISPYVHVHSETGAREKTPLLAGRSASRKDSFKEILAQLQAHHNISVLPTPLPHLLDTPQQQHVPSFHMEDLNCLEQSVSLSGSSDYWTNRSYGSDSSNQSSREVSISTVRSHDYENVVITPGSMGSFGSNTGIVPEAVDVLLPPTSFMDEATLNNETPAEQSQTESATQLTDNEEAYELAADLQVSDHDRHVAAGGQADKKKAKPTHINVMNKKEVLLPEIEEIRDKSFALPFITALCNDKTLQPMHSRSGSITGSYDMSSLRSTDSYISRISHDTDIHRVSHFGLYPGSASGTLVNNSFNAHRPFSWHSESFDLDAQLANLTTGNQPFSDNYRSVPQDLYDFSFTPETSLWAHSSSYPVDGAQQIDRYSPGTEFSMSQLMIPPKLSSGGHNSSDANISHKSLLKENIGFA